MRLTLVTLLVVLVASAGFGQNLDGKTALGFHGGGNVWFNEYHKTTFGPGAEMMLRYGISKGWSIGLTAGWELLKVKDEDTPPANTPNYLKADGVPVSLILYFNLSPGSKVTPFIYAGAGAMGYWRRTFNNIYVPEKKMYTTIHVPVGFALDVFLSKNVSLAFDIGYRFMDDWTDDKSKESTMMDGYATAKAGLNFYFGTSDSDDDDGDGLTNGEEKNLKTDMKNPDTDNDGLKDGEEVKTYTTNALAADTDGDGLKDGEEVRAYKTDPKKADTDGDGLNDGDEVTTHKTDPLKGDTDGDTLSDGAEISVNMTNPLSKDTDGDGLTDGDEVTKYKTNPTKADTDAGTINDGTEVARGTNPLDAADDVPQVKVAVGAAIVLEGVTFKTGSAEILPESEEVLTKAFNTMKSNPTVEVEVHGYTDNVGKRSSNIKLSQKRADAVKQWMVFRGIDSTRLKSIGKGPDNPIASNKTPEGRAKNRRIEFYRTK